MMGIGKRETGIGKGLLTIADSRFLYYEETVNEFSRVSDFGGLGQGTFQRGLRGGHSDRRIFSLCIMYALT
jgi:hypothetical protein